MSKLKTPYEPRWEIVEHGWRAVVLDMETSTQFTAFVKYIDAPYLRVWAGQLFDNLEDAQAWCRREIANNLQHASSQEVVKPWHAEPPAWQWLWETLSAELGEERALEIRTGLADRLHQQDDKVTSTGGMPMAR